MIISTWFWVINRTQQKATYAVEKLKQFFAVAHVFFAKKRSEQIS